MQTDRYSPPNPPEIISDLIFGLFGVPTALAIQNVAEKAIEQENYLYKGICYILLFMTLCATYIPSTLILLKRVRRWEIYVIFILLGAITSVAVILAGIYYPDVRPTLLASVIGVLCPTLTFGFILPYWLPMVQDRRSLTSVLLGLHSIMVLLLCLIIYDILP